MHIGTEAQRFAPENLMSDPLRCPSRLFPRLAAMLLLVALALMASTSRADTVASLLGNFTVNQHSELSLSARKIEIRHAIVFGQLPALRELHLADRDGDGVTSQSERDAYALPLAESLARQLVVTVDGIGIPLQAQRATTSLPTEQTGFSLRIEMGFVGDLPATAGHVRHVLSFANDSYAGRFGWQEIVVKPSRSVAQFDTDAFSTSLTAGLTESVRAMPESGPLAERSIALSFVAGPLPASARPLGPRPGSTNATAGADTGSPDATSWLARQTRRIVELVSARDVPPSIALLALAAALVLGVLHALSPGHGKTVVGAYLVGSRGTPAHAVFLGATVTITHTLGVFALGFATLAASSFIVPERLLPLLSFGSGLLVLAIGVSLFVARWRAAKSAGQPPRYRPLAPVAAKALTMPWRAAAGGARTLAFAHGHAYGDHVHGHPHHHDHAHGALVHSHGGSIHSHLPPGAAGEKVTLKSLVALGVSGGLVPCPSAMVLLLAAIALNKTAYGMLLVLAFSIGLAATLTTVGLAFLYARDRLNATRVDPRWRRWLPVASAGVVTAVGIAMCYGALVGAPF
jgi:ABC-type nickel/cobalt efflux system permease component RcnA